MVCIRMLCRNICLSKKKPLFFLSKKTRKKSLFFAINQYFNFFIKTVSRPFFQKTTFFRKKKKKRLQLNDVSNRTKKVKNVVSRPFFHFFAKNSKKGSNQAVKREISWDSNEKGPFLVFFVLFWEKSPSTPGVRKKSFSPHYFSFLRKKPKNDVFWPCFDDFRVFPT